MGLHREDGREGSLSPSLFLSPESPRKAAGAPRSVSFPSRGHLYPLERKEPVLGALRTSYGRTEGARGRGGYSALN